jgi:hypothetical protein
MTKIYLSIIAVLFVVIILQRQCTPVSKVPKSIVTIDTVYKHIKVIEIKEVPVYKTITKRLPGDIIFVPDNRNIYVDTIKLDSIGHIVVTDTLQYNRLRKRTCKYDYTIPVITKTVTEYKETRQLYMGIQLSVETNPINYTNAQLGLLYKDKHDRVFGVHGGISYNQKPFVGVSSYWLIKTNK